MITILGEVPSQKNSKKVTYINGRPVVYTSASVKEWQQSAAWQLKQAPQYQGKVTITMTIYRSTARRVDLDNMASGCLDALVKAEIIQDDSWKFVLALVVVFGGIDKANPRVEIELNPVSDSDNIDTWYGLKKS